MEVTATEPTVPLRFRTQKGLLDWGHRRDESKDCKSRVFTMLSTGMLVLFRVMEAGGKDRC